MFSEEDMSAMTLLALDRSFVSEMTKNKIYDLHFSTLEPPNEDGEYTIETAVKWAESHHKSVVDRARERKIQAMYASVKNICLETE